MAHTPGPWYWEHDEDTGRARLFAAQKGKLLVMDAVPTGHHNERAAIRFSDRNGAIKGGVMYKADVLNLENSPDARLIAAAPDLLEACKAALSRIEGDVHDEVCVQLRAAIARAEAGEA